jgi:hypothetical protein
MLVSVVQDTAQFFELTLLLLHSEVGLWRLVAEFSELFLCILTAAESFAIDPTDHDGWPIVLETSESIWRYHVLAVIRYVSIHVEISATVVRSAPEELPTRLAQALR